MAKKTGVYIECEHCGNRVYKTMSQYLAHEHHFCGKACESADRKMRNTDERTCEYCGGKFYVRKSLPNRFCCIECQHEWQKSQVGVLNPKYNQVMLVCESCGKEYFVPPHRVKACKHHFCSNECRVKWYGEVWSQQEEWRVESSKRASRNISKAKNTNTAPQVVVNEILSSLGIKYINEFNVVYYSVDNYLDEYGLFVEVMGDYWHCNPTVYNDISYECQRKTISRDKRKHSFVLNKYSVETLYIWESDAMERPDLCKELIKKYVANNGSLSEYNSFNYQLQDGDAIVSQKRVRPFAEYTIEELNDVTKIAN